MKRDRHLAKVLDNVDPEKAGGAKIQVNDLVDGAPLSEDYAPGIYPLAGGGEGFYYAPQVGSLLEVEVEADADSAVEDLGTRWVGQLYTREDPIPAEFSADPTKRGGIKFGAQVFLQDKAKELTALISGKVRLGEEEALHPLVRGDTWNQEYGTWIQALDTWLTAMDAYLTQEATNAAANQAQFQALETASTGLLAPLAAAFGALRVAWQSFGTAVGTFQAATAAFKAATAAWKGNDGTWLSTKCKTE